MLSNSSKAQTMFHNDANEQWDLFFIDPSILRSFDIQREAVLSIMITNLANDCHGELHTAIYFKHSTTSTTSVE